jgi:MoxR-like ATPase
MNTAQLRTMPLIGPAAAILDAARQLHSDRDRFALLLEGDPGIGKTHLSDQLAAEISGSPFAVEQINGQSLGIELVRQWRAAAGYGNLFSSFSVKRIDELDQASSQSMAELLTYLDYLPPGTFVIATTNEYGRLRAMCKGRLETRFIRFRVDAPSVEEVSSMLVQRFKLPIATARTIARGAVPDGCLQSVGCNVRAAINDAIGYNAARKAMNSHRKAVAA